MKIILVLLDGLGDRSYRILNHQTPLQAAHTPNLDRLAELGSNGLFHASLVGQCLPSETAHYLLFGYEPDLFPGRGLLEAVGYGIPFQDEDVLSLAHLVGVNWLEGVPILAQGRKDVVGTRDEMARLYASLEIYETEGMGFRLHQTRFNDGILVISGKGASPHISDNDPMVVGYPLARVLPMAGNPEPEGAAKTAGTLNRYLAWSYHVLSEHEVNRVRVSREMPAIRFLATQRAGRRIRQEPFVERWGLCGMFVASGAVFGGLAHELGMDYIEMADGENPGEDMGERIALALDDLSHDFIHIHTKVPDEAAHGGDPKGKESAITALDRGLIDLVRAVEGRDDLLVAVTSDHSTPTLSPMIHSGEPVPFVLAGKTVRRDQIVSFDEISAAAGCMGTLRGRELMLTLLNYSDRASLLGHHLGPRKRPYMDSIYEGFNVKDGF